MKIKYQIYKITNVINGKIYIGQHKLSSDNEPLRHYMGKGIAIREAYKKYGIENFSKIIIEEIEDDEKHEYVSEREKFWINELHALAPNGYNISPGGEGGITRDIALKSLATKIKNGNLHLTEETKKKISMSNKGKTKSEIHKLHLKENHHTRTIHVISFENEDKTVQTFDSIGDIAKKYNVPYKKLTHYSANGEYCNGIRLDDYIGKKFSDNTLCKKEKEYRINARYYDPIRHDIVSFYALRSRKAHHVDIYKDVVINNYIIK